MHDVLQAEADRAGETSARFIINSTLGLGGILDLADSEFGIERHNEDFGQTLAVWGIDGGPFVMLPFVGPSNPRDSVGGLADIFIDPVSITIDQLNLAPASPIRLGLTVVDARERNLEILDELEASSLDFYSTMRSAYRQNRAKEIRNGAPPPEQDMDDIFEDFEVFEEGEGIGNRPTNF